MGKKRKTDNKPVNEDKGSARTSLDVPRASTATNGAPDGILPSSQQQDAIPSAAKGKGKGKEDGERTEKEGGKEEEEEKVEDKSVEADRLKEQGNVAFKAGRYDEAVTRYTDAIALVSSQAAYYGNRAAAYISLKQFRLALEDCQKAKSLQQASPQLKTLLRLARCQLATGSPSPALSTLREAQALEGGGGGGTTNRDLWQLKTNAETMQRHLDSVAKARAKRDWSTASAALEAARRGLEGGEGRDVPTEWRCWAVELKMARGDWNGAMEAVKDAQRYEGNSPDIYALRGQVLFLTNKPAESTSILRHAISLDPENATARRMLKRVKELEKIKEDGNAAFKYSKWEEAVAKYSEALEVVGENPEEGEGGVIRAILLSNRAIALSKIGTEEKYEEALADLDVSLKLHPDGWKAVRTRARIHLAKDDYEQAISDFREALELAESGLGNDGAQNELREEIRKAEVLLKRSKEKDYYSTCFSAPCSCYPF
ncbi:hypothetical protein FRC19_000104 [Serendipita sp. 401]|nr:hypothetical protein FRC19_000104 [Serendipita sp. 401]KAG9058833.1 hypothetical protein FS842_000030 [Serendipita sp. 407]